MIHVDSFVLAALTGMLAMGSPVHAQTAPAGPVVAVTGGTVQGRPLPAPGGADFKGIPYAAPPVGELRWRETQPVKPWQGVLQVGEFRVGCGQTVPEAEGAN